MYKLLLVDDEEIIRTGVTEMIDWEAMGVTLSAVCENALSALESMTDDLPDILMTDVRMPGMDGLELVKRAKEMHPRLRAIILSGYDTFAYAQQAMHYGVTEYLLKPCAKEEMERALRRVLGEVDLERGQAAALYARRQERLAALKGQFEALCAGPIAAAALEKRVREIAGTADDPGLLREALVAIVAENLGGGQAEWKLNAIAEAFRGRDEMERLIARSLMQIAGEGGASGFVREMADWVDAHYMDESLTLQFVADSVVHMSADYIGREFTRAMGRKFSAYLLETRMERAKALMAADPAMHSYEIAEQVGLGNNPHYFSQVFRKYTGQTVMDFRRELEEKNGNLPKQV